MINRILIRIKVLQIVYSFYQNGNNDLKVAENELLFSLRKSYDLYHYFLLLIIEVTNLQQRTLDAKKSKYMPTHAELNPNTRLVNNRFAAQVAENEALQKYVAEQGLSWVNDEEFIKNVLDLILASDLYNEYLDNENDSYETDKEFWRAVFKKLLPWDNQGVNFALMGENLNGCPNCGENSLESTGKFTYTNARKYDHYRCKHCGANARATRGEGGLTFTRVTG